MFRCVCRQRARRPPRDEGSEASGSKVETRRPFRRTGRAGIRSCAVNRMTFHGHRGRRHVRTDATDIASRPRRRPAPARVVAAELHQTDSPDRRCPQGPPHARRVARRRRPRRPRREGRLVVSDTCDVASCAGGRGVARRGTINAPWHCRRASVAAGTTRRPTGSGGDVGGGG